MRPNVIKIASDPLLDAKAAPQGVVIASDFTISAANIGPNGFHQNRIVLMADVDPALGQEILDVAQRQWVLHVHHCDQTKSLLTNC
jgi:hypothetical protein